MNRRSRAGQDAQDNPDHPANPVRSPSGPPDRSPLGGYGRGLGFRPRGMRIAGKGLLVLIVLGAGAVLAALFWVRDSDLAAARDALLRESSTSSGEPPSLVPKISREGFEFRLPLPGEKGKHRWKVCGGRSVSVGPSGDRILDFRGEMIDQGEVSRLSSATALFDREKRTLSCRGDVVLQSDWARINAPEMAMEMESDSTLFSGGVEAEIDTEKAPTGEAVQSQQPEQGIPGQQPPGKPKEEKKKRSPLIIKSWELHLQRKKNLVVFIGDVVATDEAGTIVAEKMEAQNYSEEEKKKNPDLKGIKRVKCTGNVKISQAAEGKGEEKQAICAVAVYDAETNTVRLYHDPETGKKVVYRDEVEKWQAEAHEMILYRDTGEVKFVGEVKAVDYNPDRKSFLGFTGEERAKPEPPPGSGQGPETAPK